MFIRMQYQKHLFAAVVAISSLTGAGAALADDVEIDECVESGRSIGATSGNLLCNELELPPHGPVVVESRIPQRLCSGVVTYQCRQTITEVVNSRPLCSSRVAQNFNGAYNKYVQAQTAMCPEPPMAYACPFAGAQVHRYLWCQYGDTYYGRVNGQWLLYRGQSYDGAKVYHLQNDGGGIQYARSSELDLVYAW